MKLIQSISIRIITLSKTSILFVLLFTMLSNTISSQNHSSEELKEEANNSAFQKLFFEALSQKATNNYRTAIDKLDQCNELIKSNHGVLFELSKNYLFLNKIPEALEFANQALAKEPKNIWVLEYLVRIYKRQKDYANAIVAQLEIIKIKPKQKSKLVYLHLQNKDRASAQRVLKELSKAKMLTRKTRHLQKQLTNLGRRSRNKVAPIISTDAKTTFEKKSSFANLKKLLLKLHSEKSKELLVYTEKGLMLFPAQPFVYLMDARASNSNKAYQKAVTSLENGFDFIIDDSSIQKEFYKEFVKSYKGLKDTKNEQKYRRKL